MGDEILSAIYDWNPWIQGDFQDELLGIPRDYQIMEYLQIPEIKILEGVRRSGKSTLLYQIAKRGLIQDKKVLYLNFDDKVLKAHPLSDIYYKYLEKGKVDYLLLDEIQECEDWVPFVRKCYDTKRIEQIWLTGSNSSLIRKEYAEVLTGRNIKLKISPLSFHEFLKFKGMDELSLPTSKSIESKIKALFDNYMTLGAFPAITLRTVLQRELLINYFDDFIYKDIASRHSVNTQKLKELAMFMATYSSKNFSYRNIAKSLNMHPNTINDYVSHMQEVFLFQELYKFDYSLKKQYSNDKKIYMIDSGLANAVSFRFSEDLGRILETVIYQSLARRHQEIFFHKIQHECDFIIKQELKISQAIQVTLSLEDFDTKEREFNGLIEAMQTYKLEKGLIITKDEEFSQEITVGNRIFQVDVLPAWKWMLTA